MKILLSLTMFLLTATVDIQISHAQQLPNVTAISDLLITASDPGETTLDVLVQNNGGIDFNGGLLGLYVSLDTVLDTNDDSLLFSFSEPAVAAGDTNTFSVVIDFCNPVIIDQLPEYAIGNNFYLVYKLDLANNEPESNENDNTGVFTPPLFINCTLGIPGTEEHSFTIIPNLSNGYFQTKSDFNLLNDATLTIENAVTQTLTYLGTANNFIDKKIEVSFLPPGLYVLKIQSGEQIFAEKMMIQK